MKMPINSHLVLGLCMFSIAAAGAVRAAEPVGDGQEQARVLLSGNSSSTGAAKPHLAVVTSDTNPADAQEQARQMVLGGRAARVDALGSRAVEDSRDQAVRRDAQELARRMILATPTKAKSAMPRLASKAE
jgi:hypothetical protein